MLVRFSLFRSLVFPLAGLAFVCTFPAVSGAQIKIRGGNGVIVQQRVAIGGQADAPAEPEIPATQPQEAPATQPSPAVLALVNDLSSDAYKTREDAQKKLIEMSDSIAPELRGALAMKPSDEATQRILGVLHKFDETRHFGPSIITMHYTDASLQDVLDDFARQSDADMGLRRSSIINFAKDKRVSIDLDRANFWQAAALICSRSGLQAVSGRDGRFVLDLSGTSPVDISNDKMVVSGPFAMVPVATSISFTRSVAYGKNPNRAGNINALGQAGNNGIINLQLVVVAEPKLRVISGNTSEWLKECVDDKKHPLVNQNFQTAQIFVGQMRQWSWFMQANLQNPPDIGTRIALLKGALKFVVEVKSEVIEIDDVMKASNVTRVAGNNTLTLKNITNQNNQYQVNLSVIGGSPNETAWVMQQQLLQSVHLLDDKGVALQPAGTTITSSNPGRIDLALLYNPNGAGTPQKLTWEATTETKDLNAPFEITNLELPPMPK